MRRNSLLRGLLPAAVLALAGILGGCVVYPDGGSRGYGGWHEGYRHHHAGREGWHQGWR
jgi:hypothetical protein